jgi:hypothetical protein
MLVKQIGGHGIGCFLLRLVGRDFWAGANREVV